MVMNQNKERESMSESEYPSIGLSIDAIIGLYKEAKELLAEIGIKMETAKTDEEVTEVGHLMYQSLGASIHASCFVHIMKEGGHPVLDALDPSEESAILGRHIVAKKQHVMTLLFLKNNGKAELVIAGTADGMVGPKSTKVITDQADIMATYETLIGEKWDIGNITGSLS